MKLSVGQLLLIALLCNLTFATDLKGQKSENVFEVELEMSVKDKSILDVFMDIESRTKFKFALDKKILREKPNVTIDELFLGKVLASISNQARLNFRQVNDVIAVTEPKGKETAPVEVLIYDKTLQGKVTDDNGEPLIGATVRVKDTQIGAITDVDGNFSLSAPDDAEILEVSYTGFTTQEIVIGNRTTFDISLETNVSALQEVVVVGYGTQEVANLTSSVASVSSESFKDIPVASIEQGFAAQLPGVEVIQSSGRPGQANQINIRGISTITAGTNPLIVVDGLPLSEETSINVINPNDIESIQVLKDAASAAIYGSRGSNGVILITTKKGKEGKPVFSFNAYIGTQEIDNKLDLMNANQHAIWDRDARNNYYMQFDDGTFSINDNTATREANASALGFNSRKAIIPSYVQPYLDGESGLTDTDWQDELFRNAKIENYQISARGGTQNTKYFVSANIFNQEGIILNTDFSRFSFRSNLETDLSDKLKMGLNLAPSFINENVVPTGFNDSPVNGVLMSLPYFPAYNADGSPAISVQTLTATEGDQARAESPVAMALLNKDERSTRQLLASTYLEYEVIEGLKAKGYVGVDLNNFRREEFDPSIVGQRNTAAPDIASGSTSSSERFNWVTEYTLNYERTFGEGHNFDVLAGYTYQEENFSFSEVEASDFPNDFVETLNAGIVNGGESINSEWVLISYLGRLRYNYQGKYLFSAAIRRDGSSRFSANNRWGIFPSVSAGYRISDEAFFPATDVISDLKVRGSWGIAGNNQIGDFGSQALLGSSNAIINGGIASGLAPSTSPNPNLGWEQTTTTDIGLDLGLFDDKIVLSADYYIATTEDLLLDVPVPAHSGFTESLQNLGRVENRGIELNLAANYNLGPVKATTTVNYVSNTNEVLELGPGQEEIISGGRSITRVGGELGASYGYKVLGIFQSEDQIANTPSLANAQVGEYIYADLNSDGEINSDDRTILGSIHPDYTFGITSRFEYKGFDLSTVIQGVQGVHIHNRSASVLLFNPEGWGNGFVDYFNNYYTPERGESAIYARPNSIPTDNGFYRETDLLQEDASFVRVRNITLGYTLPTDLINKVGITSLRFYVSSKNPFTSTDFRGFNPEQRSTNILNPVEGWGNYPLERSIVFGVNMNF